MTDAGLDHLALLEDLQDRFLASISDVDPTTPVPWCGRWRVKDLVVHLARVHHWAAGQARRQQERPLGRGPFDLTALYARCADELRTTLGELGPDADSWTLLGRGPAAFWHRRQAHETLVHLWDLRTAGGLPLHVRPAVWGDTVDEVLTVLQPRQEHLGRMAPLALGLDLVPTDLETRWHHGPLDAPGMRVTAPADQLALMLWGRVPADEPTLEVHGDRRALAEVLAQRLTP